MKIGGGVIAALVIALALVMWRADAISDDREVQRNLVAAERATHAVTRQSVQDLKANLAKFVGAGRAARVAQLAAIQKQAPKSASMRAQAEEIRAMAEAFAPEDPCDCSTPDFVMEARQ